MTIEDLTLETEQHVDIKAPIAEVFQSMLHRLAEGNTKPDGTHLDLKLEQWPGGRWYRDRGNGVGHLWGHVQVLRAPDLLELSGPMFMSYPAINHVEVKLEEKDGVTKVTLRHRAVGLIEKAHKDGVSGGWKYILDSVRNDFPQAAAKSGN
jgi:hypothetical protein